jgi:hypothetical protein
VLGLGPFVFFGSEGASEGNEGFVRALGAYIVDSFSGSELYECEEVWLSGFFFLGSGFGPRIAQKAA